MTCKNCIYYEVCKDYLVECAEHGEADRINNPCTKFKNKADFVEVVRCKGCKFAREQDKVFGITDYKCSKHNISCLSPYDFCSYGERK